MQKPIIYCRWSPTLGALENTAERVWGTPEYECDRDEPCIFFGLYGLPDFYELWRHRGRRWILWAGTDILHFKDGYWLEEGGGIRLDPKALAEWINEYCESWVENEVERKALEDAGVYSKICPSFLGLAYEYEVSFHPSDNPKLYTSVSGNDYELYGWYKIRALAEKHPDVEFHLYGSTGPFAQCVGLGNVFDHGRVPKEQMNKEIKQMQGGLRLTEFDGFSEILAKSILWGQWPVSLIKYPHILALEELGTLKSRKVPNYAGRNYYLNKLNKYPWNKNK